MELYVLRSFVGLFFVFPFRSLQLNCNNLLALFALVAVGISLFPVNIYHIAAVCLPVLNTNITTVSSGSYITYLFWICC